MSVCSFKLVQVGQAVIGTKQEPQASGSFLFPQTSTNFLKADNFIKWGPP